jgi:hypothetical protein
MKTYGFIMAVAMAFSSAAYAAEPVRQAGMQAIVNTSCVARYDARLQIIVWPDGGGLEADPDIGMLAMNPVDPEAPALRR